MWHWNLIISHQLSLLTLTILVGELSFGSYSNLDYYYYCIDRHSLGAKVVHCANKLKKNRKKHASIKIPWLICVPRLIYVSEYNIHSIRYGISACILILIQISTRG